MALRKFLFLNKDNDEVAYILTMNDESLLDAGFIAGLLSNPKFIKVNVDNKAGLGWKWNGDQVVPPQGV